MNRTLAMIRRAAWLIAGLVFLVAPPGAWADFLATFTNEHVDVDLRYEGGQLSIGWHDETHGIEYEADEARVLLGPNAIRPRPAGTAFNFLGVGPGAPVFILPQVQDPSIVFLGLSAEEINNGLFRNNQVTLSLVAVRGPGDFSLYATDVFGMPTAFMATSDGISPADRAVLQTASDAHYNWAFTAAGTYEVDLELSGTLLNGETLRSEVTTLTFSATTSAVPEPATGTLLLLGAGSVLLWRRRKA